MYGQKTLFLSRSIQSPVMAWCSTSTFAVPFVAVSSSGKESWNRAALYSYPLTRMLLHARSVICYAQSCLPAYCSLQLKELSRQLKGYVTCSPVLQLRGSSTWVGSAGFDLQMHVPAKFASQVPPAGKCWGPSRTKVTIYH